MKNANVMIALVVGLVLGLIVGRITADPSATESRDDPEEAVGLAAGSADTSPAAREAAATDHDLHRAEIDKGWVKGSDGALVTIVEYSNFQCGFCARAQPTIERLLREYGDDIRLVWKHMPMGEAAMLAAQATEAAGAQDKFWEYRDKLYENPRALARADLERYAQELGLDMNRFQDDLDNETHKEKIDAHVQSGRAIGVRGTPYFFINGRQVRGAQPFDNFKEIVDEEKQRAEAVLAAGVSRVDLYPTLIAAGERTEAREAPRRPQAEKQARQPERQQPERPQFGRPDISNAHSHGPDDALVTIVEFSNIQCGFCARVRPTLAQIKEEYGDKVRFAYKHQVRPGPGQLVAEAGEAAGAQGKFFEFMDKAFENRRQIDRESLEAHAEALGLDMATFKRALDENEFADRVAEHRSEGMRIGARGTPSFFINGRLTAGAQPFNSFKKLIDEEIEKAEELIEAGTSRDKIYSALLEKNEKEFGAARAKRERRPPTPEVRPAIDERLRPAPELKRADVKKRQQRADRGTDDGQGDDERVEVDTSAAIIKGSPDAPVTLVEFSAYTCGFCGRVQPTVKRILEEYEGRVKLAFMHRPMGRTGHPGHLAAQASLAANEQGKFWEYHAKLFENMRALTRPDLESYAEELGLDMDRFKSALDEGRFENMVDQHSRIAGRAGAAGTPTFFINGRKVVGAQPFESFKKVIDEELGQQ